MPILHQQKNRGSITLGMVFGIGILGLGIAATTLTFSTAAITNNSHAASGVRALVTADAATREGVYRTVDSLVDTTINFSSASIPTLNQTNNANVTVSGSWPIVDVEGTADNSRTTRKVMAKLDLFPSAFAFDQAIYTDGGLDINGGANLDITGDVYATDDIDIGGNPDMNGNIYSHGDINGDTPGDEHPNYPEIEPPLLDTTPYEINAAINGNTANNSAQLQDFVDNQDNIIVHVTAPGEVSLTGGDFNGMIIVEEDLALAGGITLTADATPPYDTPLVLYVKGDLRFVGNTTIHGIIYVEGETSFGGGNVTIDGSIISVNGASVLSISGSVDITYSEDYGDAWDTLFDDGVLTGAPPQVKEWHEE